MRYLHTAKITVRARQRIVAALVLCISGTLVLGMTGSALAAGDASLHLTPGSGTYAVGGTLTVYASATSSKPDNMNAAQLVLTYPAGLLTYKATNLTGPFTLCAQNSGGNGMVRLACASPSPEPGTHDIAAITFTVIAPGTAQIAMTTGTNVVSTNGSSVWNKSMNSVSYMLLSGSRGQSAAPVAPLGSISLRVTEGPRNPVPNAVVTLTGEGGKSQTQTTIEDGVANFTAVQGGTYTIAIDASHLGSGSRKITLNPGQNKIVSYELSDDKTSYVPIVVIAIVAIAIVTSAYTCRSRIDRLLKARRK